VTRIAYLDCFSGLSGDMLLGAILDAGLPLPHLRAELKKLPLSGFVLDAERVKRAGLSATRAIVRLEETSAPARTLAEILDIFRRSSLPDSDKQRAETVFRWLAEAEAEAHGETVETVHLHDVGALDAIVDVAGAVAGLRLLGARELYCSPLPLGQSEAQGPHGTLPVPAPATLHLVSRARAPVRALSRPFEGELVTPTGAAIATALARFQRPSMTVERVGYGAGSRDPAERPNVLRLWIGETSFARPGTRAMLLIETNIDDMTPEMIGYVTEKLLTGGSAADVWLTPVQMKKGRPGVVLSVICAEENEEKLVRLLLRETSTLGVRVRPVQRWEAERETVEFQSSLGPAAVKIKRLPGEPPLVSPEFEACRRIAETRDLPLAEVYRIVQAEALERLGRP
jgi:uncharacterized protein (TIGR00299 family) protein